MATVGIFLVNALKITHPGPPKRDTRRGKVRREDCTWKKHCASYECEECQEGSRFRIAMLSSKKHRSTA